MEYVYIPDPNLKAAINYQINHSRPPEQDITEEEMLSLVDLYGAGRGIIDLTGLQAAKNLIGLDLTNNKVTNLLPLQGLNKLVVLYLSNNPITDINVLSSLQSLEYLLLLNNPIANIKPLSTLVKLKALYLLNNKISDIEPLRPLVNLEILILAENQITDIGAVESLTKLSRLYLFSNKITNIQPIEALVNLIYLSLYNNEIVDISPLKALNKLPTILIYNNKIEDLTPLKSLVNLERLMLNNNKIEDLSPLSGLVNLVRLDISNNKIADLSPLKNLLKISVFNAGNQTVITKGNWSNGTLTISTAMLKNKNGSIPNIINNIEPPSGVYDSVRKTVTWSPISYNTEVRFNFVGENTFSGIVIREGNTGPKALQLQLKNNCKTLVNYDDPVIFNKTIYASGINYNSKTGTITFTSSGLYSINWWVAGVESVDTAVFAIQVIGGEQIIGNANNNSGQVVGNAIIEVITAPMEIQLINLTTRCQQPTWVMLSNEVPVHADISIVDYFNYRN